MTTSLSEHLAAKKEEEAKKALVVRRASEEGLKTGVATFATTGAVSLLLNRFSHRYRTSLSLSGKCALVVMASLGLGTLRSELIINAHKTRRTVWGVAPPSDDEILEEKNRPAFDLHLRAANYMYRHPFQMLFGMGAPAVGYIFWQNRHKQHLPLSRQLMHTRVFGQASVLTILMSVMFFRDYMDRRGGAFEIEGEDDDDSDISGGWGRFQRSEKR